MGTELRTLPCKVRLYPVDGGTSEGSQAAGQRQQQGWGPARRDILSLCYFVCVCVYVRARISKFCGGHTVYWIPLELELKVAQSSLMWGVGNSKGTYVICKCSKGSSMLDSLSTPQSYTFKFTM